MEVVNTQDVVLFCNDLRRSLVEAPEFGSLREIKYLMSCIHQNYAVKKDALDRSRKAMSQDLRDLETMQGKDSTDYECKKQAHLKESEALHRQIAMIEREQEQAELAIEDVKSKLEQLEHAQEVRETDVLDKQPPFKEFLDLYLSISSIKWNYDSPTASGTIYLPEDVIPFEFDPASKSQFEITNEIWKLLD